MRRQLISCPGPREWPVSPRRAVQSSGKLTNAATAAALHEPDENSSSPLSLSLSFKPFCQSVPPDCPGLDLSSYMNVNIITVWCGVQDFQPPAAKNEKSCVAAPSS